MADLSRAQQDRLRGALRRLAEAEADAAEAEVVGPARPGRPHAGRLLLVAAAVLVAGTGAALAGALPDWDMARPVADGPAVTTAVEPGGPTRSPTVGAAPPSAGPASAGPASAGPPSAAPAAVDGGRSTRRVPYDLPRLVAEADRVVTGRVREVRVVDGAQAVRYVLALIEVEEGLRGPVRDVWALDADRSGSATTRTTSDVAELPWQVGQQVLLFLVSDVGTDHEGLDPPHEQVLAGSQGRYEVRGGRLVTADFTLEQVRAAVAG